MDLKKLGLWECWEGKWTYHWVWKKSDLDAQCGLEPPEFQKVFWTSLDTVKNSEFWGTVNNNLNREILDNLHSCTTDFCACRRV